MDSKSSYSILQVERAASDLRRGQAVILSGAKESLLVSAGEYVPEKTVISDGNHPAVKLLKIAGLLPQAVIGKVTPENKKNLFTVTAEDIENYPESLAVALEKVSEAQVPLKNAENTKIIAFRPRFGHLEHLAIIIGNPVKEAIPYVRLHSSCITGDVLGSLRCDCGSQLQQAIEKIEQHAYGIVLYLSQEGRGIGIANKLRAYALQDQGMDTVEANEHLGFLPDERDFAIAAEMLRQLGVGRIVLMTNNPAKMKALAEHGIEVVRREPLVTKRNTHNNRYLNTKARKLGHHLKDEQ